MALLEPGDQQLQSLIDNMQGLAERLAAGGSFIDAMLVTGGIVAIRALRTKVPDPPAAPAVEAQAPDTEHPGAP